MSFDLRADQIRIGRIISSGSLPLLIYPSSSALNLAGGLANFSTASIGSDVFIYVSGSSSKRAVFGGDVRVSGSLTASVRTVDGTNLFMVGSGVTINYNSLGQFELTGATATTPGGSDKSVQFNRNGTFTGDSSLTYNSGTLGVATLSGSNGSITELQSLGLGPGLLLNSVAVVSQSLILASGINSSIQAGGFVFSNGAGITGFSGSLGQNAAFATSPGSNAGTVNLSLRGAMSILSGGIEMSSPLNSVALLKLHSGSTGPSPQFQVFPSSTSGDLEGYFTGSLNVTKLSGSIRNVTGGTPFLVGRRITANYNTTGQWELSGAFQQVSIAPYSRTNLTSSVIIGYAYFTPNDYPWASTLAIEAVGMNMGGVSGGLRLYNQTDGATSANLSWSGTGTLTTGSYQTATFSIPASAKSFEIHLSQSGAATGGASYTSVGFVNFRIS